MTRTHTEATLHFGKCLFCGSPLGRRHIRIADRFGRPMGRAHPTCEPGAAQGALTPAPQEPPEPPRDPERVGVVGRPRKSRSMGQGGAGRVVIVTEEGRSE